MGTLSLRDDVFLLSHRDDGRLAGQEASIGAGLAGATLIDLLLSRRAAVSNGRLVVLDATPTGDPETDATVEAIGANTAPCGPRAWVALPPSTPRRGWRGPSGVPTGRTGSSSKGHGVMVKEKRTLR